MDKPEKILKSKIDKLEQQTGKPLTSDELGVLRRAWAVRIQLELLGWSWQDFLFCGITGEWLAGPGSHRPLVILLWGKHRRLAQTVSLAIE